jgi:hypothetical protein
METQDSSITRSTPPPSIMETGLPAVDEGSKEQQQSIIGGDNVEVYMKRPCPEKKENGHHHNNKKQKKQKGSSSKPDLYRLAYENVTFVPIPSTGRPGTPHCLFQESYTVHWNKGEKSNSDDMDNNQVEVEQQQLPQIVHKHANGLVIVTAGNRFTDTASETFAAANWIMDSVNYLVDEAPSLNAGERRKIQSKMMHNKKISCGVVEPSSIMCRVVATTADTAAESESSDDKKNETNNHGIPLYSCVWGAIMEINPRLLPPTQQEEEKKTKSHNAAAAAEPSLLATDPLLDGYLAVMLPTGPFPPKEPDEERD